MANNVRRQVTGVGNVCLKMDNGDMLTLKNVMHVPDLCYNLISCASLEKDGLVGRRGKGVMKIMNASLVV